jgi:hypothetical protein
MTDVIVAFLAVLFMVMVLAVPIGVLLFINGRFKRSARDRLAQEPPPPPFASPKAPAAWTRGLLGAAVILAAFAVNSGVAQIGLLSRILGGYGFTWEEVNGNDSRQTAVAILQVLFFYAIAVPFLIWFRRAHKNLPSLGRRGLVFSPGWAVGFFFVPFLNLVRPFQAMREIWYGSDPGRLDLDLDPEGAGGHDRLGTPPLVGWWWALFILSNVASNMSASFYSIALRAEASAELLLAASILTAAADLLLIPSALVAMRLVGRVTRWQVQRAELIRQRGGQPVAAPAALLTLEAQRARYKFPYFLAGILGFGALVIMGVFAIVGISLPRGGGAPIPGQPSLLTRDLSSYTPGKTGLDAGSLPQAGGRREIRPDQPSSVTKDLSSFTLGKADLIAEVTRSYSGATYYEATGRIVNNGTKTYQFVMVKVEFLDRSGRVVGTLMTEARREEYVFPGRVSSFTVRGNGHLNFQTTRASIAYSSEVE